MRKILYITIASIIIVVLAILLIGGMKRMTPIPQVQGWIYPGAPSCSTMTEIADGRTIDTLKAQYYTLNDDGTLSQSFMRS